MPKSGGKTGSIGKGSKAKVAGKTPGSGDVVASIDKAIGEPYTWDMLDRLEKDLVVEYMRKKGFRIRSIEQIDEMF